MDDTEMFPNRETLMHARLHFDGAYDYLLGGGYVSAVRDAISASSSAPAVSLAGYRRGACAGFSSGIPPTGCGDAHLVAVI